MRESVWSAQINENEIPEEARQIFLKSLGVLRRKSSRRVSYDTSAKQLNYKNTKDRQKDSCSAAELSRDKSIFYRSDCATHLPEEQRDFFNELQDEDGNYAGKASAIGNDYNFKTPVNLVIADSNPERRFIRNLFDTEIAKSIDGWLKNTSIGFYSVEYAWSRTSRPEKGGATHQAWYVQS